jgi:glutamine amidotransferase
MIGIVDYGMGNLKSVFSAFEYIGANVMLCSNPKDLKKADQIVIPGVGAIEQCILKLKESGFKEELNEHVLIKLKPTLGICLGMQVMCNFSYEGGKHECLGWFDAEVLRLNPELKDLKVPNIGWNQIEYDTNLQLFENLPINPDLYFVHSYHVKTINASEVVATYKYGEVVTAAIQKNNIFATQFHPEKSQDVGLQILNNFIKWRP